MQDKDRRQLRNLLLDCRAALRRHFRQFEDDPLRKRIDAGIAELDKKKDEDELAEPDTLTAQQVAYAWQIAARGLKLSHPELYDKLSRKVHDMLDAEVLDDPATEILELERDLERAASAQADAARELATLHAALAEAMPLAADDATGSELQRAQRRIQMLLTAASSGPRSSATAAAAAAAPMDDPLGLGQTREGMLAVLQGRRGLAKGERSWCIAEAMVLSGKREPELRTLTDIELVKLAFNDAS